jgi:hypothetical protein
MDQSGSPAKRWEEAVIARHLGQEDGGDSGHRLLTLSQAAPSPPDHDRFVRRRLPQAKIGRDIPPGRQLIAPVPR